MTETQQTSDIYGILIDPATSRVLMLEENPGIWNLPHVHLADRRMWLPYVGDAVNGLRTVLSADITALRNVHNAYSEDRQHVDLIYDLENHTPAWTPPTGSRWVSRADLADLHLDRPEFRPSIDNELREVEAGYIPELRPPWACRGWFETASTWMREQLRAQGYTITAPIVQVKSWGISSILSAETTRGRIYFKVSTMLPLFGNEPAVLNALASYFPDEVPAPIAIEPERRWMLMEDFGPKLTTELGLEAWETTARRFARLQIQSVPHVDALRQLGCLDRRPMVLETQIDPLLYDERVLGSMPADEVEQVRALAPRLKAMCSELASYNIPYTLNHGDLHSGNITQRELRFYDWTDACISHPFLDLATLVDGDDSNQSERRAGITQAYLNEWTAFEPYDRLSALWQIAEPLGALHQAVSYQHIVNILEPTSRQELLGGAIHWLRRVSHTTKR